MSRFGGRYAPNLENEVRRAVKEPVSVWRQEWVSPSVGSVEVYKWVKTDHKVEFQEDDDEQQEMVDDAIIEPHLNTQPAVQEVLEPRPLSLSGGLGSIAPIEPKAPASALPPHMRNQSADQTPSPGDSPAATNPQVASELHPPPSGLPTKEEEEEQEDASHEEVKLEQETKLTIQPSDEVQQKEEIIAGHNDDQVQVAPEATQEDVEMTSA